MPGAFAGRSRPRAFLLVGLTVFAAAMAIGTLALTPSPAPSTARSHGIVPLAAPLSAPGSFTSPALTAFSLSIGANPGIICAADVTSCPAGVGESRVQIIAQTPNNGVLAWPAVQVAFVIETTAYDGVWGTDPAYGLDPCGAKGFPAPLCEESNGVPFFVAHAQQIANSIQLANPHSKVSFAMVDYYDAWGSGWDDQDGPEYNVDIGQFIPASEFGSAVVSTFQTNVLGGTWYSWDQDLDNNFLDASSITALYGAIIGSDLNWTNGAHHVVVWMGSTAPRDPSYLENYCVSPSQWHLWGAPANCYSQSCEPSYPFEHPSPECEGWVRSQDGIVNDSIAGLARTAPACRTSIGGVCTVDTIDLPTTTTDPYSPAWPTQFKNIGGGPGGTMVQRNVGRVIAAGCDLAAATGGTWDGPSWAVCPNGEQGSLQLVPHGSVTSPNTENPGLLDAFRQIGFGPVVTSQFAAGTDQPMFTFVPFGAIQVAPDPQWSVACVTPNGYFPTCQRSPSIAVHDGVSVYGWNWSTNGSMNIMRAGDLWVVSFNVQAAGPPFATVPVDACVTLACRIVGSGAESGFYTWAHYLPYTNISVVTQSFPVATVTVELSPSANLGAGPPPPSPPPAIGPPIVTAPALPVPTTIPLLSQVGIGNVSVQAASAGFLAAGFLRVTVRNRPIAVRVAAKSGTVSSRFDEGLTHRDGGIGRFE